VIFLIYQLTIYPSPATVLVTLARLIRKDELLLVTSNAALIRK